MYYIVYGPFDAKKIWHLVPKVNHNLSTVEGVQTDLTGVALAATTAETFHPNSFHEFSYQFYENSHQRNGCCVFLRKIVTTYTNLMSFFPVRYVSTYILFSRQMMKKNRENCQCALVCIWLLFVGQIKESRPQTTIEFSTILSLSCLIQYKSDMMRSERSSQLLLW